MPKFRVGQDVYAPVYKYPGGLALPYALVKGTIRAISARSCEVDLPYGIGLKRVASSLLHHQIGVCIVRIGDFRTELTALDPVCKSTLNFLRLLLPDDQLKQVGVRTKEELEEFFQREASAYSIWIFVGHGTEMGELCFTRGQKLKSSSLARLLGPHASAAKTFLFLCCHSGLSAFSRPISLERGLCNSLIAPKGPLHSAVASQFAQTFLSFMLLEGRTVSVAFNKASTEVPGSTRFRHWRNGRIVGGSISA